MKTYAKAALAAALLSAALIGLLALAGLRSGAPAPEAAVSPAGSGAGDGEPLAPPEPAVEPAVDSIATGPERTPAGPEREASPAVPEPPPEDTPPPLPEGFGLLSIALADRDGRPVAGARVTVRSGLAASSRESDARGEAVFEGLAGGIYSLLVDAPPRPVLSSQAPISLSEGEDVRLEFTVGEYGRAIAGTIRDQSGAGVPGIEVVALRYLFQPSAEKLVPWSQEEQRSVSGADGRYAISGLAEGEYEVRTIATEVYPSAQTTVRAGVDAADLVLLEGREARIEGTVTDAAGTPLSEARVLAVGQAGRAVLAGDTGEYELSLMVTAEDRLYTLRFFKQGYREKDVTIAGKELVENEARRLDVQLEPVAQAVLVEGVIRTAEGAPVGGETVHLHSSFLNTRYQATSDASGRFVLGEVQAGLDYRVWLRPLGPFADYDEKTVKIREEETFLEIVLEPLALGTLSGRVTDADGRPVPRFSLWVRSAKAAARPIELDTDDQGRFALDAVPEGALVFETRSLPRINVSGIELAPGEAKTVELVIDWGAFEIAGEVKDGSGNALPGAQVYLSWFHRRGGVRSGSTRSTVADETGRFQFTRLGPGPHRLSASAPGYRSRQVSWETAARQGEVVFIELDEAARR